MPVHDVRCPLCQLPARADGSCPDCGQDLSPLSYLRVRPALRYNRALALVESGDHEGARRQLEAAVAEDDAPVDAWVVLGKLHARHRRTDAARTALTTALTKDPEHAAARAALAALDARPGVAADARRARRRWTLAVLGGLAMLALAVVLTLPPHQPTPVLAPPAPVAAGFLAVTVDARTITLIGPVPDEATRGTLTTAAAAADDRAVVDALTVDPASGAVAVAPGFFGALTAAPGGERSAVLGGSRLMLAGTVPDEPARRALLSELAATVPGVAVDDQLRVQATPDPSADLATAVSAVQAASPILFPAGQVTLGPRGLTTVRAVAGLLTDAGEVTIQVDGHAAATPGEDAQAVSEQRANSVRDALIAAGVDPAKITTRGLADTAPRETPGTSRRAEITVHSD